MQPPTSGRTDVNDYVIHCEDLDPEQVGLWQEVPRRSNEAMGRAT